MISSRNLHFHARAVMACILVMLGHWAAVAHAQDDFVVEEIQASPELNLIDFEFDYDPATNRFAWIDRQNGDVWIGYVDPLTGDFDPPDGKGILVDTNGIIIGNGPEWVAGSEGPRLVYVKIPEGAPPTLAQATLVDGTWVPEILTNGSWRILPLGSLRPNDPAPAILNLVVQRAGGDPQMSWRHIGFPSTERIVPQSAGATGGRWVPDRRDIVFSAPINEGRQIFHYRGDTGQTEQITFDTGRKQTVFMWRAPEFNDEYVFFASIKGENGGFIRLYREVEISPGVFEWTVFNSIFPPAQGLYFWSPEPFVHNGKSYLFTVASTDPEPRNFSVGTQVWLMGIDPAEPFFRNLSDNRLSKVRMDPEVFVTDQGPFVYFTRYDPKDEGEGLWQREGTYRVDTGLGP